jgi:AhpD family alkylhydroperoxidase
LAKVSLVEFKLIGHKNDFNHKLILAITLNIHVETNYSGIQESWLMDKIEEIRKTRKAANSKLLSLKSKVYERFLQMEEAAYSDGALTKKQKELIAIGISVVIDCESCMEWHITQAAAAGASKREVLEAVEVGIEFGGGPATVSARFALEVMEHAFKE